MKRNRSTGPRSVEGKAHSSMNALKSGVYSKSLVIPGEDPAELDALRDEYHQRFSPTLPEQRDLVEILVRSTWTLRRLAAAESQILIYQMDTLTYLNDEAPLGHAFTTCSNTLSRLQRIVNSTQRNYRDTLRLLERLQPPPAPVPAPVSISQPTDPKPVNQPEEFVSLPAAPLPAKSTQTPAPFHKPGAQCHFEPPDLALYRRCPVCFPEDGRPE